MALSTKNMAAETREELVSLQVPLTIGDLAYDNRVYPPSSGDWRLVGARWEIITAVGVSASPTIDIKDASGNAVVTQLSLPGVQALGARGTFALIGTDAQLNIHSNGGNAYHAVVPFGTGSAGAAGMIQIFLSYRRVQPSGDLSATRQS